MAIQNYGASPGRLEKFKGEIILAATPFERLCKVGRQVQMPLNNSKTYVARKFVDPDATATKLGHNQFFQNDTTQSGVDRGAAMVANYTSVEGITSTAKSLVPLDYTAVIQEYEVLFGLTNQTADLYEDDIPAEMKKKVGEKAALINELICYGALQGCLNQFYGGTGTSLSTVNGILTINMLRKMAKSIAANHGRPVTSILKASQGYGTDAVGEGFIVYGHTDLEPDIRNLNNPSTGVKFVPVEQYASGTPMPGEVGKCERFRFVLSPDLPPRLNIGGAIATYTTLQSQISGGTLADVYPLIVMGEDAFSQIAMRGRQSLSPTYLPPGQKSKSDPTGKRGFVGANWYKTAMIENDGWMAVANVAVTNL